MANVLVCKGCGDARHSQLVVFDSPPCTKCGGRDFYQCSEAEFEALRQGGAHKDRPQWKFRGSVPLVGRLDVGKLTRKFRGSVLRVGRPDVGKLTRKFRGSVLRVGRPDVGKLTRKDASSGKRLETPSPSPLGVKTTKRPGSEMSDVRRLIEKARNSTDWHVRDAAASALYEIRDPQAVEPLIAALIDRSSPPEVRQGAAGALGYIGDPRAVEPLIAALQDSDESVRTNAAGALGEIGDPRAVEPLLVASKGTDSWLSSIATRELAKHGWK